MYPASAGLSEANENNSFAFCLSPGDEVLSTTISLDYRNSESQQRSFASSLTTLSNSTVDKTLFLLPTVAGIFTKFQTTNSNGDPLSGVLGVISRTIEGVPDVEIVSGSTDSSGFVSFFLNPDVTYGGTFSKTGFPDNVFTFVPTSEIRTVIMGVGTGLIGNGTQLALNTTYEITPRNSTLQNQTDITFGFNVSSTQAVNFISMNISNSSGSQLLFVSDTSAGVITGIAHTGNNTKIIGRYIISDGVEEISVTRTWIVATDFIGDYSIFKQMTMFTDYGFKDFTRILLVLLAITGVLIFLSTSELLDTSESKVAVGMLLIWAFSIVGWLDTGIVVSSASGNINKLGQFSSQYGIAILSTGAAAFFVLRRVFIRKL